jgi:hypothetical protein
MFLIKDLKGPIAKNSEFMINGFVKSPDFSVVGIIEIGIAIEIKKPTGFGHEKPGHSITIPIAISIPMSRSDFLRTCHD